MISGMITNPEQANKYFEKVNEIVVKGCEATTLTVDTDMRERYDCLFTVLSQFWSKQSAIKRYEGPYQEIISLREGTMDMNFRIVERNR